MKTKEDHLRTVTSILCDELGCREADIDLAKNLCEDLGADSLDLVEIVMAVEDEYCIHIDDEKAEKLQTVGAIVDYLVALDAAG